MSVPISAFYCSSGAWAVVFLYDTIKSVVTGTLPWVGCGHHWNQPADNCTDAIYPWISKAKSLQKQLSTEQYLQ